MVEYHNVRRLGLILAIQAEIEGMKAENLLREQLVHSPSYGVEQFQVKANEIRAIVYAHDEEL